MKSAIYEVVGCSGSQKYKERGEFDNMREAKAEARRRNSERAGDQGKSLKHFMADLNEEGKFFAGKAGYDGWALQR